MNYLLSVATLPQQQQQKYFFFFHAARGNRIFIYILSFKSLDCVLFISRVVQMDELEIQQHYDEFFEEVYVEMEKVGDLTTPVFDNGLSHL